MDWLCSECCFEVPQGLYSLTKQMVIERGGARLLNYFMNSPQNLVTKLNPELNWIDWMFKKNHKWMDVENHKKYFQWLGEELGFREEKDWRNLGHTHVLRLNGETLIKRYYGGSLMKFVLKLGGMEAGDGSKEAQEKLRKFVDGLFSV